MNALPDLSALRPRPTAAASTAPVGAGAFRLSVFDDPEAVLPTDDGPVTWLVGRERGHDFPPRALARWPTAQTNGFAIAVDVLQGVIVDRRIEWESEEPNRQIWLRLASGDTPETTGVFENPFYSWGPEGSVLFRPGERVTFSPSPVDTDALGPQGGPMLLSVDDGSTSRLLQCTAVAFARNTIIGTQLRGSASTAFRLPHSLMVVRLRDPETGFTMFGHCYRVLEFNTWQSRLDRSSPNDFFYKAFMQALRRMLLACPAFGLPALARHFESAPGGGTYALAAVSWDAGVQAQEAQREEALSAGGKRARGL